jgi:hypothetical protein
MGFSSRNHCVDLQQQQQGLRAWRLQQGSCCGAGPRGYLLTGNAAVLMATSRQVSGMAQQQQQQQQQQGSMV